MYQKHQKCLKDILLAIVQTFVTDTYLEQAALKCFIAMLEMQIGPPVSDLGMSGQISNQSLVGEVCSAYPGIKPPHIK